MREKIFLQQLQANLRSKKGKFSNKLNSNSLDIDDDDDEKRMRWLCQREMSSNATTMM
jgi:hypothetical protein